MAPQNNIVERMESEYRKARVQLTYTLPESRSEAHRIDSRPGCDDHVKPRILPVGQVNARKPLAVAGLNDIGRNTDDRRPGTSSPIIPANAFSERILPGPMSVGKALIDDHRFMTGVSIKVRELTSP